MLIQGARVHHTQARKTSAELWNITGEISLERRVHLRHLELERDRQDRESVARCPELQIARMNWTSASRSRLPTGGFYSHLSVTLETLGSVVNSFDASFV